MLNVDKIVKTYSGKMGCACGCSGKYNYTADGAKNYGPGYPVNVSERGVRIVAKKVLSNPNVKWQDNIAFVEDRVRNRFQMVVFKEQA